MFHFYTPWKRPSTSGFLTLSGIVEIEHWRKMECAIANNPIMSTWLTSSRMHLQHRLRSTQIVLLFYLLVLLFVVLCWLFCKDSILKFYAEPTLLYNILQLKIIVKNLEKDLFISSISSLSNREFWCFSFSFFKVWRDASSAQIYFKVD